MQITKEYTRESAENCMILSQLVISADEEFVRRVGIEEHGFLDVRSFESDNKENVKRDCNFNLDTEGYVFEAENYIAVVFRGSDSPVDWVNNIRFKQSQLHLGIHPEAQVHSGFYCGSLTVHEPLGKILQDIDAKKPNRPVFMVGHSYGAAVALVCILHFGKQGLPDFTRLAAMYSTGMPRVINPVLKMVIEQKLFFHHYRQVYFADVVPALPPAIFKYRHFGQVKFFAGKGQVLPWYFHLKRGFSVFTTVANMIFKGIAALAYNHNIDRYREGLKQKSD
jgi:hypothetical protein